MGELNDAVDHQSARPSSDPKMEKIFELGNPAYITRRGIREYHDSLQVLDLTIRGYDRETAGRRRYG